MAKYATPADCSDPMLSPTEEDLAGADVALDAVLHGRGIDPATLVLPQPLLTQLAVYYALRLAAIKADVDGTSAMATRAARYQSLWDQAQRGLTRAALGAAETGAGYGTVVLGRA